MKRKLKSFCVAILLIFALLCGNTYAFASSPDSSISDAKSAVVRVYSEFDYGGGYFSIATGSAFGVGKEGNSPQYFVTNAHVCMDEEGNLADSIYILLSNDALTIEYDSKGNAAYIELDDKLAVECEIQNEELALFPDVAVLKAKEPLEGRTSLPLIESSGNVGDGETVYSLGFPGDADYLTLSDNQINIVADVSEVALTSGVISKKTNSELYENTDVIVHTANISHGNSGGPLVNSNGAVVGINTYSISGDGTQYVSIYIDYAIRILDEKNIEYDVYSAKKLNVRDLILWGIIIAVAVIATVLVVYFSKKEKQWVSAEEKKAYEEANGLRIQGIDGYFKGRRFSVDNQLSIGRAPGNSIVFPTQIPGVSANHCIIIRNNNQLYIKDLGSSYGTVLNGSKRLPENQLVSIGVGDKISLGSTDQTFIITRKGGVV